MLDGLVYRSSFRARRRLVGPFSSFEHQIVTLRTGNVALQVVIVYNPSGDYTDAFEADFTQLIFFVDSLGGSFVVLGDFNFHTMCLVTVKRVNLSASWILLICFSTSKTEPIAMATLWISLLLAII